MAVDLSTMTSSVDTAHPTTQAMRMSVPVWSNSVGTAAARSVQNGTFQNSRVRERVAREMCSAAGNEIRATGHRQEKTGTAAPRTTLQLRERRIVIEFNIDMDQQEKKMPDTGSTNADDANALGFCMTMEAT